MTAAKNTSTTQEGAAKGETVKVKRALTTDVVATIRGKSLAGISRGNILKEAGPDLNMRTLCKVQAALGFGKVNPDVRKADREIVKAMLIKGGLDTAKATSALKPITAAQRDRLAAPRAKVEDSPEYKAGRAAAKGTAKKARKSTAKAAAAA